MVGVVAVIVVAVVAGIVVWRVQTAPPAFDNLAPGTILARAQAAAHRAGSATVLVQVTQASQTETLASLTNRTEGFQVITAGNESAQVALVDGTAYVRGNEAALTNYFGFPSSDASPVRAAVGVDSVIRQRLRRCHRRRHPQLGVPRPRPHGRVANRTADERRWHFGRRRHRHIEDLQRHRVRRDDGCAPARPSGGDVGEREQPRHSGDPVHSLGQATGHQGPRQCHPDLLVFVDLPVDDSDPHSLDRHAGQRQHDSDGLRPRQGAHHTTTSGQQPQCGPGEHGDLPQVVNGEAQ